MVAVLEESMTEKENPTTTTTTNQGPQFIPKLKGKKVTIRLVSGGQPVTGIVERYNPYEILLHTAKGKLLVFKHAVATIETVDEPKGYKPNI
jgi:RNA chaperone Hfq